MKNNDTVFAQSGACNMAECANSGECVINDCCECELVHTCTVESVRKSMPDTEKLRETAELLKVFGDYTRIRVLWSLSLETLCVCDIAELLGMTKSAVSHQLRVLRQAKLVTAERKGKEVYYSLADGHVAKILDMAMEHIEE